MSQTMHVADMEELAAREAIARADIDPSTIDLVLTHTVVPDYQLTNPACQVHRRLGLPKRCLALQTEASTYSFMAQLTLAQAAIMSNQATNALLIQSCCASRLLDIDDPVSVVLGDGAAAAVVGHVREGYGILAAVHHAEGRTGRSLVAGVRGGRWFDEGRAIIHIADPEELEDVLLHTVGFFKDSAETALSEANISGADVGFLCIHQGTAWLQSAVQERLCMPRARMVETFSRFGYVFGAMLPVALATGEQEHLLRADDVVLLASGGAGITYGAIVMRWGGR